MTTQITQSTTGTAGGPKPVFEVVGDNERGWYVEGVGPQGEKYLSPLFENVVNAVKCQQFVRQVVGLA